jgi:hypothetical protein
MEGLSMTDYRTVINRLSRLHDRIGDFRSTIGVDACDEIQEEIIALHTLVRKLRDEAGTAKLLADIRSI